MRPDVLKPIHVTHNSLGQVCQIAFSEITKRQLPQALSQRDARILYFSIDKTVSCLILLQMGDKRKQQKYKNKQKDCKRTRKWYAICQRGHKALYHIVEDAHATHHDQIHDDRPEGAHLCIFYALITERVFALKIFSKHIIFSLRPRKYAKIPPVGNPPTYGHTGHPLSAIPHAYPARQHDRNPTRQSYLRRQPWRGGVQS